MASKLGLAIFAALVAVPCSMWVMLSSAADRRRQQQPAAAAAPLRNVTCLEQRPHGLCTVDMRTFPFAAPNPDVPETARGVVFVIAPDTLKGWTNPSIDLNRLTPYPADSSMAGKYWVDSAAPQYQTWEDEPESYSVYYKQRLAEAVGLHNDIVATEEGPQVTMSVATPLGGRVTVPGFSSPTKALGPNHYERSVVLFGKTLKTWPGYRIIDDKGQRTEYFDLMIKHCGGVAVTRPGAAHPASKAAALLPVGQQGSSSITDGVALVV